MIEDMNNMNHLHPLSWVFDKKLYRIPDYQRGYSWGEGQLKDLWNDLLYLDDDRNHYTGLLSVEPMEYEEGPEGYQAYQVVDGQQRLTTCIILLNELLRKAEEMDCQSAMLGSMPVQDIRSEYIVRPRWAGDMNGDLLFDYMEDNDETSQFFRYHILGIGRFKESNNNLYTRNLEKAKRFFSGKINELCNNETEESKLKLEILFNKLTEHLTFNFFVIPGDNAVYEVFESMNFRGKPLSNLEILKNRLLYLTTLYNEKQMPKKRAGALRYEIIETWKRIYELLGKNPTKQLNENVFLNDHWIIRFEYVQRNGEDYFEFLKNEFSKQAVFRHKQRYIPDRPEYDPEYAEEDDYSQVKKEPVPHDEYLEPEEIEDYVTSMGEIAPIWYYTYFPDEYDGLDDVVKEWLKKLNEIDITYFRPLVTVAVLRRNSFTNEQLLRLLKAIERFIFIAFRMLGYRYNYQRTEYRKAAYYLYNDPSSIDEISEKLEKTADQHRNAELKSFINHVDSLFESEDGFYSWRSGIYYLLLEYELHLSKTNKHHVDKILRGNISIEHIYPQTPVDEYWDKQFGQFNAKEKKQLAGSLGNLLPLELGTNEHLKNWNFYRKKEEYKKGGHSEHEVAEYSDWGPIQIYERGMNMLGFMSDRWKLDLTEDMKKQLLHIEFIHDKSDIAESEDDH